jgi:ApaG protein
LPHACYHDLQNIVQEDSKEISGLQAKLDKLVHHKEKSAVQGAHLHAFIYFVTIHNLTESTITLLGRKWILVNEDGTTTVVEGDKIVGECPVLEPGGSFSYNSYHVTHLSAEARGSFHGVDEHGGKVHVRMEPFRMEVPIDSSAPPSTS